MPPRSRPMRYAASAIRRPAICCSPIPCSASCVSSTSTPSTWSARSARPRFSTHLSRSRSTPTAIFTSPTKTAPWTCSAVPAVYRQGAFADVTALAEQVTSLLFAPNGNLLVVDGRPAAGPTRIRRDHRGVRRRVRRHGGCRRKSGGRGLHADPPRAANRGCDRRRRAILGRRHRLRVVRHGCGGSRGQRADGHRGRTRRRRTCRSPRSLSPMRSASR